MQVKDLAQRTMCALYTTHRRQLRLLAQYITAANSSERLSADKKSQENLEYLRGRLQNIDPWVMLVPATGLGASGPTWHADRDWEYAEDLHRALVQACDQAGDKLAAAWTEMEAAGRQVAVLRRGLALLGSRSALSGAGGTDEEDMVTVLSQELSR